MRLSSLASALLVLWIEVMHFAACNECVTCMKPGLCMNCMALIICLVFQKLLADTLNKYLSPYLDGIDPKQVSRADRCVSDAMPSLTLHVLALISDSHLSTTAPLPHMLAAAGRRDLGRRR